MTRAVPDLTQPAWRVAPRLLGCRLASATVTAVIAEVEAYHGTADLACHASKGRTPRAAGLWAAPGTLYIYLCYGMHDLLNLVCMREGFPAAVLIRGVVIDGIDTCRSNGPGKVTRLLGVARAHHGTRLGDATCPLRLLPPTAPPGRRRRGARVGIDYAGEPWRSKPWRWWLAGFPAAQIRNEVR